MQELITLKLGTWGLLKLPSAWVYLVTQSCPPLTPWESTALSQVGKGTLSVSIFLPILFRAEHLQQESTWYQCFTCTGFFSIATKKAYILIMVKSKFYRISFTFWNCCPILQSCWRLNLRSSLGGIPSLLPKLEVPNYQNCAFRYFPHTHYCICVQWIR